MAERYTRVRQIIGATGKGHGYEAKLHVLDRETDLIKTYDQGKIPIARTSVRMRTDAFPWEIQREGSGCGFTSLTESDLRQINSPALYKLVTGKDDGENL